MRKVKQIKDLHAKCVTLMKTPHGHIFEQMQSSEFQKFSVCVTRNVLMHAPVELFIFFLIENLHMKSRICT